MLKTSLLGNILNMTTTALYIYIHIIQQVEVQNSDDVIIPNSISYQIIAFTPFLMEIVQDLHPQTITTTTA